MHTKALPSTPVEAVGRALFEKLLISPKSNSPAWPAYGGSLYGVRWAERWVSPTLDTVLPSILRY